MQKPLKQLKNLLFLLLFLCFMPIEAQNELKRFSDYLAYSFQNNSSPQDSLSCSIPSDATIANLLVKEDWKTADLFVVDCILEELSSSDYTTKSAMWHYLTANAYAAFDDQAKNQRLREAYFLFIRSQDIEGQFFSLNDLFLNFLGEANYADESSREEINHKLKELKPLYEKSNFTPVKIAYKETKLRKEIRLRESISDTLLLELESFARASEKTYPRLVRSLYTSIAVAHQQKGNTENALALKQTALQLANPEKQDYPSYLLNIAGSYFYERNVDSAMAYLQQAYKMIPENSKTIYSLTLKRNIESGIASLYRQKKNNDSAYIYMTKSKLTFYVINELEISEKKLFAEKIFEVQKRDLEIAQQDIELLKKDKQQIYLLAGLVLVLVVLVVVGVFLKKTRELHRKVAELATNRERLLQIVSHDLISPLQSFSMTAKTIPKLMEKKRFEEVKLIQQSLTTTITALQDMLKNLFAWNEKMKSNAVDTKQEASLINMSESLILILRTYEGLAKERDIVISYTPMKDEVWINTLPTQLLNLLRNLIYNAVKHSPNNSLITIKLSKTKDHYLQFCCSNPIPDFKLEKAKQLAQLINSKKSYNSFTDGLGMEIIFYALQQLNTQLTAKVEHTSMSICFCMPIAKSLEE